ncbi:MAG TPA: anhydro-N-acetylmuramic acid kinase [bacterium]
MPLAIGLMSGTSCDGVSAALADIRGRRVRVLAHRTDPYPRAFAERLRNAARLTAPALSALHMELGERFAAAAVTLLRRARVRPSRVAVIGSHGHTVYHGPRDGSPSTLQLGAAAVIAERTGIDVAGDFRARDMAAGGEGAPLVPWFDEAVFGGGRVRALQNLGGIANVTLVGGGIRTLAFDTGPGNCLLDLAVQRATRGRMRCDLSGTLAAQGAIDARAVRRLAAHPYFRRRPPKSTGRELFNDAFLSRARPLPRALPDLLATLTCFTALSIADSYRRFLRPYPEEVIVSGGGVRNRALMAHLGAMLAPAAVRPIDAYGIPAQAKEPAAFALLALRALQRDVNHLPRTTGARRACVLGSVTPGRHASFGARGEGRGVGAA